MTGTLPPGVMLSALFEARDEQLRHANASFTGVKPKPLRLASLVKNTSHICCLLLMPNEKKLQLGLQLPVRATGSRSNVVEELRSRIQWLMADL